MQFAKYYLLVQKEGIQKLKIPKKNRVCMLSLRFYYSSKDRRDGRDGSREMKFDPKLNQIRRDYFEKFKTISNKIITWNSQI